MLAAVNMDTRVLFVLGCLIVTTFGFIPRFIRRDEVAQTVQPPDEMGVESRGDMEQMEDELNCQLGVYTCPPVMTMASSLFSAHRGKQFIVDNQLTFSCSDEAKSNFEECADSVRSHCAGQTKWINGFDVLYKDLCAMKPDLLSHAACMNSVAVGEEVENCTGRSNGPVCQMAVPCIRGALDLEPRCSLKFKPKFMEAITNMFSKLCLVPVN